MNIPTTLGLDNLRLSVLPKRDPRRAVLDYVETQRVLAKDYAREGLMYASTWFTEDNTSHLQSLPEAFPPQIDVGFSTPVLHPRVPKVLTETKNEASDSNMGRSTAKPRSSKKRKAIQNRQDSATSEVDGAKVTGSTVKQVHQSDEDHRLNERRERKRIKRNIMQPGEDKTSSKKSKGKKQSGLKAKLPAGLALMHGFIASNVGKNRLTIDPPLRRGVFGRGKASDSVNVVNLSTKKGRANYCATSRSPIKTGRRSSSNSISQSEDTLPESPSVEARVSLKMQSKTYKIKKKAKRTKQSCNNSIQASTPLPKTISFSQAEDARKTESITWDIEKEDGSLPSESSSQDSQTRAGTLLVHISRPEWLVSAQSNEAPISPPKEQATVHGPTRSSGASYLKSASPPPVIPSNSHSKVDIKLTQEPVHSEYFEHSERSKPDSTNMAINLATKVTRDTLEMVPGINATLKEDIEIEVLPPPQAFKSPSQTIIQHGPASDWLFSDAALSVNLQVEGDYTWLPSPRSALSSSYSALGFLDSIPEYLRDQDDYFDAWNTHQSEFEVQTGELSFQHLDLTHFDLDEEFLSHSYGSDPSRSFTSGSSHNWKPDSCGLSYSGKASASCSYMSLQEHSEISSLNSDQAVLVEEAPTLTFTEGRRLLRSCIKQQSNHIVVPSSVEVDMANRLIGHWQPQRH